MQSKLATTKGLNTHLKQEQHQLRRPISSEKNSVNSEQVLMQPLVVRKMTSPR